MNLLYTCSWCKRRLRKGEPCYGMGARLRRDVALPAQDGPFLHLDLRTQPGKTVHCAIATEDSEAKKAGWDVVLMACCPECAESLKHTLQKEAYLGEIFGLPGPAQG